MVKKRSGSPAKFNGFYGQDTPMARFSCKSVHYFQRSCLQYTIFYNIKQTNAHNLLGGG